LALRLVASDAVRVVGNRVLGALPASEARLIAPS